MEDSHIRRTVGDGRGRGDGGVFVVLSRGRKRGFGTS